MHARLVFAHTHVVRTRVKIPGIPPTAVGGLFRCGLQREASRASPNTTHGSEWIVQVQPTRSVSGFSFLVCSFRRAARETADKTKGCRAPPFVLFPSSPRGARGGRRGKPGI